MSSDEVKTRLATDVVVFIAEHYVWPEAWVLGNTVDAYLSTSGNV